eukprot:1673585-Prymnesium_polylepis.1
MPERCWVRIRGNLVKALPKHPGEDGCGQRFASLERAQQACKNLAACGGITQDGGVECGGQKRVYALRSAAMFDASWPGSSWVPGEWSSDQVECRRLPPSPPSPPPPSPLHASPLSPEDAKAARSWSFCAGSCCSPGARNRSCVYGNLFFRPPPQIRKDLWENGLQQSDLRQRMDPFTY